MLAIKALDGHAQSRGTPDGKQGGQAIRDRIVKQRKLDRVRGSIGGWVVATAWECGASAKARPPGDLDADAGAKREAKHAHARLLLWLEQIDGTQCSSGAIALLDRGELGVDSHGVDRRRAA